MRGVLLLTTINHIQYNSQDRSLRLQIKYVNICFICIFLVSYTKQDKLSLYLELNVKIKHNTDCIVEECNKILQNRVAWRSPYRDMRMRYP